jgi:hypothetical protein
VSLNKKNKDTDKGFINPEEQEQLERSTENEKSPEFDVIGTALNDL